MNLVAQASRLWLRPENDLMLELKGVSKKFGQTTVLHPTDLRVEPGKTTVLIGPSGCGKSTLLRLMVGLIMPDSGSILFDGIAVRPENLMGLRRRLGYVIQDGGLFPHLTGWGNVTLMARFLGWEQRPMADRVAELLELTRFPREALDRYPAQLSGGQRQRVSIMRALMLDPVVLLLDEPMAALDPMIRYDLQEDLKRIFQTLGKTVVLVTHDMGEAGFFGDRVVLLGDGRILQQGTLQDLIRTPADDFVRKFVNAQRLPTLADGSQQHEENPTDIMAAPAGDRRLPIEPRRGE